MPELDRLKEQVSYLKFWQGVVVVTNISVVGWVISGNSTDRLRILLAALGIAVLSFCAVVLHRAINRRVERIGGL